MDIHRDINDGSRENEMKKENTRKLQKRVEKMGRGLKEKTK